jgi:hypothetical protein
MTEPWRLAKSKFRDGNTDIGDAVAVNNGTATTTTSTLEPGHTN